jgi:diguanylate cyclase (GGDEF)-like protein
MTPLIIRLSALVTLCFTALGLVIFGLEFDFAAEGGWVRTGRQRLHQEELSLLGGFSIIAIAAMGLIYRTLLLRERTRRQTAELDAFTDPLTGLHNRRCFLQRAGLELLQVDDDRPNLALFLIDLDHFKAINDTHGHSTGDAVLVAVADRLARCFPQALSVARLGGDEFVVLDRACGAPARWVRYALDHFSAALAEPLILDGAIIEMGASVGVSFARSPRTSVASLLADADGQMYQRKRRRGDARQTSLVPVAEHG